MSDPEVVGWWYMSSASLPATKVEICNPHSPGKMNTPLLGKMTASLVFSGCFVTLLIWGCTTVVCLVDEKVTAQPATVTGYPSTQRAMSDATAHTTFQFACVNSDRCRGFCQICQEYFGAPTMDCLSAIIQHLCVNVFESDMASLNSTDWCIWGNVNRMYSNFSRCTEDISDCLLIPWPNPLVEQTFVDIHTKFFKECSTEDFSDPPPAVIFALVITPICLIPVMVSLVVLKTKNGDGSS